MSNKTIQKIDAQLAHIDELITNLLDDVDLSELSAYQRLMIVSRLMGLAQKGIAIRQTCQAGQSENRENLLFAAYMRDMRGEPPSSDDHRIIEQLPLLVSEEPEESDGEL